MSVALTKSFFEFPCNFFSSVDPAVISYFTLIDQAVRIHTFSDSKSHTNDILFSKTLLINPPKRHQLNNHTNKA